MALGSQSLVAMMLLITTFAVLPVIGTVQAESSVQLINLLGDPITATCVADNVVNRGARVISPMGVEEWEFNGDVLSVEWTCHFDWEDSSDCAPGGGCKRHSQDVRVWQPGVMGHRKLVAGAIAPLTPCASCVWQIKFDGFYRADKKDLVYTFIAGWN